MSIEQWGVLALVVFLPLLEGAARFLRTRASSGGPSDRVAQAPTSQRGLPLPHRDVDGNVVRVAKPRAREVTMPLPSLPPPPLPQPVSQSAMSLSGLPGSHASTTKRSGRFEAHTQTQKPGARDAAVQWLRPVRNLRRAMVVATILGRPTPG